MAVCEDIGAICSGNARPADGTPGTDRGSFSFSGYCEHQSGHVVVQLDPYAVRPAVSALSPAEKFGASTRKILRSLNTAMQKSTRCSQPAMRSYRW